jgi:Transposase
MHVEALNWSGLIAKAYAEAHRISINSLRTWRARLDACPMQIDWRARLHPSARLAVSTNASDSAKGLPAENILTAAPATDPPTSERRHRRRFSGVEKRAIVLETEQPGATVSQIARTHRIVASVLFRWRAELGFGKSQPANLAAVRIAFGLHLCARGSSPCHRSWLRIPRVDRSRCAGTLMRLANCLAVTIGRFLRLPATELGVIQK